MFTLINIKNTGSECLDIETFMKSNICDIFVFDSETTGFIKRGSLPDFTEVGVLHLNSGKYHQSKVKPSKTSEPGAILTSGLDPKGNAAQKFYRFL